MVIVWRFRKKLRCTVSEAFYLVVWFLTLYKAIIVERISSLQKVHEYPYGYSDTLLEIMVGRCRWGKRETKGEVRFDCGKGVNAEHYNPTRWL